MNTPAKVIFNGQIWEVRDWDKKRGTAIIRFRYSDERGDHITKTVRMAEVTPA